MSSGEKVRKQSSMKILILGSNGFIGSHLKDRALKSGDEVRSVDVSGAGENHFVIDPISVDLEKLKPILSNQPNVCVFAAGSSSVQGSFENSDRDFFSNVTCAKMWLSALQEYSKSTKFLYLSSAAVYGNPVQLPITENSQTTPISPYGHHKLDAEKLLFELNKNCGVPTLSARIFSAYGPGLRRQLFWDMSQKIALEGKLQLSGSGNETRDFIYIDDLVDALFLLIKKQSFDGGVVNVASGKSHSISMVAGLFVESFRPSAQIIFTGSHRVGDPISWDVSISKLQKLGYCASVAIDKGIKNYIRWLEEKG